MAKKKKVNFPEKIYCVIGGQPSNPWISAHNTVQRALYTSDETTVEVGEYQLVKTIKVKAEVKIL